LDRRREEYRKVFLDGLRYPWPPVADHAAEALVALRDHAAIPDLSSLLGKPDPAAPVAGPDHKVQVAELVCVNHLRNCLLCHAPSVHGSGLVRAPVPSTDQPLSEQFLYYNRSFQGPAVRADTTYLKQDFAALQPVAAHGVWPEVQRFDYMIRMRELSASELKLLEQKRASRQNDQAATYPQREAVLFALKGLKESSIAAFLRVVSQAY
jgi:hypothetical protein